MVVRPRSRRAKGHLSNCQDCHVVLTDANWTASMQKYGRYICGRCWADRQQKYEAARKARNPNIVAERRAQVKLRMASWTTERKVTDARRRYGHWLLRTYDISIDEYEMLLILQDYRCKICHTEQPRGRGAFHLDHCHISKTVRGILCTECNMMLGLAKDNTQVLKNAIEYLSQTTKEPTKNDQR